jgi:hypothetical protein
MLHKYKSTRRVAQTRSNARCIFGDVGVCLDALTCKPIFIHTDRESRNATYLGMVVVLQVLFKVPK